MQIRLTYINGRGKRVVKDFSDPMDVIGYVYRCYAAARNAESTRRISERLNQKAEGMFANENNEMLEVRNETAEKE